MSIKSRLSTANTPRNYSSLFPPNSSNVSVVKQRKSPLVLNTVRRSPAIAQRFGEHFYIEVEKKQEYWIVLSYTNEGDKSWPPVPIQREMRRYKCMIIDLWRLKRCPNNYVRVKIRLMYSKLKRNPGYSWRFFPSFVLCNLPRMKEASSLDPVWIGVKAFTGRAFLKIEKQSNPPPEIKTIMGLFECINLQRTRSSQIISTPVLNGSGRNHQDPETYDIPKFRRPYESPPENINLL